MTFTRREILIGAAVVVVSFAGALWAMDALWPRAPDSTNRPALAAVPPLPPTTRSSLIVAPATIALTAIRDVMEKAAPRTFAGSKDNPLGKLLANADIGYSIARSPLDVKGSGAALTINTVLSGTLRVTGQHSTQAANITGTLGGLIDESLGRSVQNITGKALDQRADIRGNVKVTARPALLSNWRIEPNLAAQVAVANGGLSIAGVKINVANEMKPLIDRNVNDQIARLQARIRNDPFVEQAARREWAKMCRSIPLAAAAKDAPKLWLELKPTRAFAAQPKIDASDVTLTLGVQAETRIVPQATRPDCPFPARLELVQAMDEGRVAIGVPIDVPFSEINRLLEAQIKGKTFPQDGSGAVAVTVRGARVAASGERLLISLAVKARERKSWFGFGTEATVHVWGRPALDAKEQMLRLADVQLAVESDAAFGLIDAAARAAVPYLQAALAESAVIDLKPFAADARKSIAAALADFRKSTDGVEVTADITGLRLAGIAFDSKTLRVIAEVDGTAKVAISKLPGN
jgi:hypothetical protein